MTADFSGKVVLVTGAGQGIGRAIAQAFAARGAVVAANDINPLGLDETLKQIEARGGKAREYVFDIARRMPVQAMLNQVMEDWGRIDILVNAAAVEPAVSIWDMDEWDWHRTIDVNLGGAFFTMQQVGRLMRQKTGGAIINLVGRIGEDQHALQNRAAYLASQMGLVGLTRAAADEFAMDHIRVNLVCLGSPDLPFHTTDPALAEELSRIESDPLERAVRIVLYLCSSQAGNLTGQVANLGRK